MATRKWGLEATVSGAAIQYRSVPVVTALKAGGYVIAWQEGNSSDGTILAQRFDTDGHAVGGQISVLANPTNAVTAPSITGLADGGFEISSTYLAGSANYIESSVFGSTGALVRDETVYFAADQAGPSHISALGGGAAFAWYDPTGTTINFRTFDAAGNGSAVTAATTGSTNLFDIAGAADGSKVAVTWTTNSTIYARLYDPAGNPLSALTTITSGGFADEWDPKLVWLNSDEVAVEWRESSAATFNDLKVRIYEAAPQNTTDPLLLDTGTVTVNGVLKGSQQSAEMAALPNGGFAVVWNDGSTPQFEIKFQAFDGAGNRIGSETLVTTEDDTSHDAPSLAVLPDGRVVVTWEQYDSNGDGRSTIHSQIVDWRDGVDVGGPGNDPMRGNNGVNDEMSGLGGNDVMWGLGGDDAMFGGTGNDVLRGGTGADSLDGGTGTDTADYGDKAVKVELALNGTSFAAVKVNGVVEDWVRNIENVVGGSAGDHLVGDAGNNLFRGGVGKDTMDGAGGTNTADYQDKVVKVAVTLNGATAVNVLVNNVVEDSINNFQNVNGGAAGDALTGDVHNNVLNGLGGNDSLRGGTGRDVMSGGVGADHFIFASIADSGPLSTTRDIITDFVHGTDKVDLSLIDADTTVANNQAFAFDATKGTSTSAVTRGHVAWYWEDNAGTSNDHTIIKMNVDADTAIESTIQLNGLMNLSAVDFTL